MLPIKRGKFINFLNLLLLSLAHLALGETKIESDPISCSEVGPENFHPQAAYIRNNGDLTSSVSYNGAYKECYLGGNRTLRVELDRVFKVSDIGIFKGGSDFAFDEVLVTTTIELSSNETANSSCLYRSTDEEYAYFRCNSKGLNDYGGFMASAIEIRFISSSPRSLQFSKDSTWMFVIHKPNENHQDYAKQCREPAKYTTQTFLGNSKQYYQLNEKVTYYCSSSGRGGEKRTCGENGQWSDSPPRCLPTNRELSQPVPFNNWLKETNHEAFYYFHDDFDLISSVTVYSSLSCTAGDSGEYSLWLVNRRMNTTLWKLSSSQDQSTQGCILTFFLSPLGQSPTNNANRTIHIKSNNEPIETVTQVYITKWTREVDDWMESGCPPIDPYIGMADEYAGPAAINIMALNEKLLQTPCRDGFWLNNSAEFKKNPRRCNGLYWTGTIPKCILLTCKTPPNIPHGYWRYSDDEEMFNKVQYTCEEELVPSNGHGVASCHYISNEWIDIPTCDVTTTSTTPSTTPPTTPFTNLTSSVPLTATTQASLSNTVLSQISDSKRLASILGSTSVAVILIIIFLAIIIRRKRRAAHESASNDNDNEPMHNEPTHTVPQLPTHASYVTYAAVVKSLSERQSEPSYTNASRKSLAKFDGPVYISNTGASATHDSPDEHDPPDVKTSEDII